MLWDINQRMFFFPPALDFPTLNFGVKAVMKTSVLLTWDLPPNYKSQVPFKVSARISAVLRKKKKKQNIHLVKDEHKAFHREHNFHTHLKLKLIFYGFMSCNILILMWIITLSAAKLSTEHSLETFFYWRAVTVIVISTHSITYVIHIFLT